MIYQTRKKKILPIKAQQRNSLKLETHTYTSKEKQKEVANKGKSRNE